MELWSPRREDYFAAQVAYEIARGNAKHPGQVKRDWFLNPIPFKDKRAERVNSPTISKHRTALVKGAWAARVQVAGPRPAPRPSPHQEKGEKGKGRARKGQATTSKDARDARGKRFEVVQVVQQDREELDRG